MEFSKTTRDVARVMPITNHKLKLTPDLSSNGEWCAIAALV